MNETQRITNIYGNISLLDLKTFEKIAIELRTEVESRDALIVKLTEDKKKHLLDLKKSKRSYLNLYQQLQDERDIYSKEKEHYVTDFNEHKFIDKYKLDTFENLDETMLQKKETENLKIRLHETNNTLQDILRANYNLSIKFLRMKNMKLSFTSLFRREQVEHSKLTVYIEKQFNDVTREIYHVISEKFNQIIAPSQKTYLQVLKHNRELCYLSMSMRIELSKMLYILGYNQGEN